MIRITRVSRKKYAVIVDRCKRTLRDESRDVIRLLRYARNARVRLFRRYLYARIKFGVHDILCAVLARDLHDVLRLCGRSRKLDDAVCKVCRIVRSCRFYDAVHLDLGHLIEQVFVQVEVRRRPVGNKRMLELRLQHIPLLVLRAVVSICTARNDVDVRRRDIRAIHYLVDRLAVVEKIVFPVDDVQSVVENKGRTSAIVHIAVKGVLRLDDTLFIRHRETLALGKHAACIGELARFRIVAHRGRQIVAADSGEGDDLDDVFRKRLFERMGAVCCRSRSRHLDCVCKNNVYRVRVIRPQIQLVARVNEHVCNSIPLRVFMRKIENTVNLARLGQHNAPPETRDSLDCLPLPRLIVLEHIDHVSKTPLVYLRMIA